MITGAQIKKIYALCRQRGIDSDDLHSLVYNMVKKEHIKELTKDEAIKVIDALDGKRTVGNEEMITNRQRMYIKALAEQLGWNSERLRGFIKRTGGVDDIRFLKKKNASAVIEGLKKMKEKGYGEDQN